MMTCHVITGYSDDTTCHREASPKLRATRGTPKGAAMDTEIWILGGTGRSGRVIASGLMTRGLTPVLVGRDPTRLAAAARVITQAATEATFDIDIQPRTLVAASLDEMAAAIRRDRPAIVINTVGPFATTAEPIARACLAAGSHYIDLANDVGAVATVLGLR